MPSPQSIVAVKFPGAAAPSLSVNVATVPTKGWPSVALTVMPEPGRARSSRPMLWPEFSVNQRLPSAPATISEGAALARMPVENSVMTPAVVIRPIRLPSCSANQRLPSGPRVIPSGELPGERPAENSVTTPAVVIRPIRLRPGSVNQRLPSGPATILTGKRSFVVPTENSVTTPAVVIRPILSTEGSANQRLPSGPTVIPKGSPTGETPWVNSVMTPAVVIRPIPPSSVNQRLPSGPAVISKGSLSGSRPAENSVTTPAVVIRPILPTPPSVNQRLPSGPAVIPTGCCSALSPEANPVTTPAGVIRPMRGVPFGPDWVNQTFPSGPRVIPRGWLVGVEIGNSRIGGVPDRSWRGSNPSKWGSPPDPRGSLRRPLVAFAATQAPPEPAAQSSARRHSYCSFEDEGVVRGCVELGSSSRRPDTLGGRVGAESGRLSSIAVRGPFDVRTGRTQVMSVSLPIPGTRWPRRSLDGLAIGRPVPSQRL